MKSIKNQEENDDWMYKSILQGRYIHENRDAEIEKIHDEYSENDEIDMSNGE